MFEIALSTVASIFVFVFVSYMARRARNLRNGILSGILAGAVSSFTMFFSISFLMYVLPVGQMDFWLAALLHRTGLF
jgi:hypothetical protein